MTKNRLNNVTPGVTAWTYLASTANLVTFVDDNIVDFGSANNPATSRAVNPSIVPVFTGPFAPPFNSTNAYIQGHTQPSCQLYNISITGGGHFFVNGVDTGFGPLTAPLAFIYFSDILPPHSIVTGLSLQTETAFTATGLTSLNITIGDGVGSGPPAANEFWYTQAPYDGLASASATNHMDFTLHKTPRM